MLAVEVAVVGCEAHFLPLLFIVGRGFLVGRLVVAWEGWSGLFCCLSDGVGP